MAEENKFTHIGVLTETQKRVAILAKVSNGSQHMYDLIDLWAKDAWEEAKQAGIVTDAMLNPQAHWVRAIEQKKKTSRRKEAQHA